MADYYCSTRTNYFRVTDEERYKALFKELSSENNIVDFTEEKDGVIWHGFGASGVIDYKALFTLADFMKAEVYETAEKRIFVYENTETDTVDDDMLKLFVSCFAICEEGLRITLVEDEDEVEWDLNFDVFTKRLQEILNKDDSFIIMETGHEKLRYVSGSATIVTKGSIRYLDLSSIICNEARDMLGNPDYCPQLEY